MIELMWNHNYAAGHINPYEVKPSYSFWAPWIGKDARSGELI